MTNRFKAIAVLGIAILCSSSTRSQSATASSPGKQNSHRTQSASNGLETAAAATETVSKIGPVGDGPISKPAAPVGKTGVPESDESSLTSTYRVGTGDVLDIRVRNLGAGASTLFTVLEGGAIDFPILGGPITVAGQTTEEIQARLISEFKRRALLDAAQISISVRQYASHSVIINGLVVSGGMKFLRREAVPLYVILAESQSRLDAARASIMRINQPVLTVDLTDPSSAVVLVHPGDVINISARPELFYYIGGRINNPGQKVFQPSITLLQSILAAGGIRNQGDATVELSRDAQNGILTTTRYSLKEIKGGRVADPRIQPGDRIEILR